MEWAMPTKKLIRTVLWAGTIVIAGEFHCTPTLADSPLVVRSVKVPISDLDLAQPQDARVLRRRIEKAARTACGPEPFLVMPDPPGYVGYQTCYTRALEDAQLRIAALIGNARRIRESARALSP
jgi:UrcA family protein